jgi:hypothetical protein
VRIGDDRDMPRAARACSTSARPTPRPCARGSTHVLEKRVPSDSCNWQTPTTRHERGDERRALDVAW